VEKIEHGEESVLRERGKLDIRAYWSGIENGDILQLQEERNDGGRVMNKIEYHSGPYDEIKEGVQYIRITDGCPNGCEFCYCPGEKVFHGIPEIRSNQVKILDMNFLSFNEDGHLIEELGEKRYNEKVVHYELVCGVDWLYLTFANAKLLKKNRFEKIRFAWDEPFKYQYYMKKTVMKLREAGYKDIGCFIISNWKVPLDDCLLKLDLLKIWNVKALDCYYDGQTSPDISPVYWREWEIKEFRKKCRKHNQMVLFGMDPEYKQGWYPNNMKILTRTVDDL
jgi:hypothetical protein